MFGITDIFLTKSNTLIGNLHICIYFNVVKITINILKLLESWSTFWHTKILEIFDRIASSESPSQFCPESEFGHSTKIRVFCWRNYVTTCKTHSSFSNKSLGQTLTTDVIQLHLMLWLSSRCAAAAAAVIIRYNPVFRLTTAL